MTEGTGSLGRSAIASELPPLSVQTEPPGFSGLSHERQLLVHAVDELGALAAADAQAPHAGE